MVECLSRTVAAMWLRGLICVVPKYGGGRDRRGRYCVQNLAMDMYCTLLQSWQDLFRKLCWSFVFLKHHTFVRSRTLTYLAFFVHVLILVNSLENNMVMNVGIVGYVTEQDPGGRCHLEEPGDRFHMGVCVEVAAPAYVLCK